MATSKPKDSPPDIRDMLGLDEHGNPPALDPELESCIEDLESFRAIRHPLVYSVPYDPMWSGQLNKLLAYQRQQIEEGVKLGNARQCVYAHERPHRFMAMNEHLYLVGSDEEAWSLFAEVWIDSENLWQQDDWIREFLDTYGYDESRNAMKDDEREFLDSLPDEVTVYRGHTWHNQEGWSWTLDFYKAFWFANRYTNRSDPKVSFTRVRKSDILFCLHGRGEWEVVLDPDEIFHVEEYAVPERPADVAGLWSHCTTNFRAGMDTSWMDDVMWDDNATYDDVIDAECKRSIHGYWHWLKVERNVNALADAMPGADKHVCQLFAILHDSQRVNENRDPEHGPRAAKFAADLFFGGNLNIDRSQLAKLVYACKHHTHGMVSDDPTVGCCWDADRLDLIRVGMVPRDEYLSTDAAKRLKWNI